MGQYIRHTLQEGLSGWQVTDCLVTMTECAYSIADGPPSRRGPLSTPADFRKLTPLVRHAVHSNRQERSSASPFTASVSSSLPTPSAPSLPALTRLGARPETPVLRGLSYLLEGEIPAARVHELTQQLPALTRGEGVLESAFDHYQPVRGTIPTRPRSDHHPLNRKEYVRSVGGRLVGHDADQ